MKQHNIKKYVFIAVVCLTVLFIWSNSLKLGDDSMDDSNGIKELLLSMFSYFGINLENTFLMNNIRKLGHFAEYFILGAELMSYKFTYLKNGINSAINVLFFGTFVAFVDESIQLIPALGRSAEVVDVWIDLFGILTGFVAIFLARFVFKKIKMRRC